MIMHVDFTTRRSSPWPEETQARLAAMYAAHKHLQRPAKAGRVIGLKRGP